MPRQEARQAYALPGLAGALVVEGAAEIIPALGRVLHGWAPTPAAAPEPSLCTVSRDGAGYAIASAWLETPLRGLPLASAVCAMVADIAQSWLALRPGWMALHGGAAILGGRLFAFTGAAHAGKSTLMARLGAEPDITILGDDMLPLDARGVAHAMGVAPRLRLPLPTSAAPGFRDHVAAATCLSDDAYAYTRPRDFAPHGLAVELHGLIVLDRRRQGHARLHELPPAERVRHIMARNMAEPGEAMAATIPALAYRLPGLRLVYSDLEEAVALLRQALGGSEILSCAIGPAVSAPPEPPAPPAASGSAWRRAAGVVPRRVGRETFLWQREAGRFHHLNPMAGAIWLLLEEEEAMEGIAALLAEAYPDTPHARIITDVAALLGRLATLGLVEPAPPLSGS